MLGLRIRQKNNPMRRCLAAALSAAMICGTMAPAVQPVWGMQQTTISAAGAELSGRAEPDSASGTETTEFNGEISLFQAASDRDFRSYGAEQDWYLGIRSMERKNRLSTTSYTTDYDGVVIENTYTNEPPAGYEYVILRLVLTKTVSGGESFAADQLKLTINGTSYDRVGSDSFLTNHNYEAFPNTEVLAGSKSGHVVFEVRSADVAAISNWKAAMQDGSLQVRSGGIAGEAVAENEEELISVPMGGTWAEEQFLTEQRLLAEYQAKKYPITAPFLVRDPYDFAPLAGIAMFETDGEAASIQVTVKGKVKSEDITYEIKTSGTEHQVPIFGLYPGYQNTVLLEAKNEKGATIAESGPLKSEQLNTASVTGYETIKANTVVRNSQYPVEQGLTFLISRTSPIIDAKGDVRWFRKPTMAAGGSPARAQEITDRGTFYFVNSLDNNILCEMNFTGKIIAQYYRPSSAPYDLVAHHDLAETPDGTAFIYPTGESMVKVDKLTGAVLEKRDIKSIFNAGGSLHGSGGGSDWAHQNTVSLMDNGHYMISLRNQFMVFEYDFEANELIWAFSPKYDVHLKKNPSWASENKMAMLQNVGGRDKNGTSKVDWFYAQHDVEPLPDLDNDPNTLDFSMFDNGMNNFAKVHNSRAVHYRLDRTTMKVEQISSYGENDPEFYGVRYGNAQYLENTGNFVATSFSGKIVESTSKGAVAFSAKFSTNELYRCYRMTVENLVGGFKELTTVKGKTFMNAGAETDFSKTAVQSGIGKPASAKLSQINSYEANLILSGTAYRSSAGASKSVWLVADDGKDWYCAPLLTNSTASTFEVRLKPISTAALPQGRYSLGLLVQEGGAKAYQATNYYLSKTGAIKTVQTDDAGQQEIVEELIAKAKDPINSIANPVVALNPFDKAPLSALAAFHTPKACTVKVTVQGKPAEGDRVQVDISYEIDDIKTMEHVVPIVGLYPDYTNTVLLEAGGKSTVLRIKTGALNETYVRNPEITATAAQRGQTAEGISGLTFLTPAGAQTVPYAIDVNGDIRWAYMCAAAAPLETKPLRDGHLLVPSNRAAAAAFSTDAETALEIDLTGRIYGEYYLEGQPHHEVVERQNGNLIFALSRRNSTAVEDYMAEVDRKTGQTIRTWDLRKVLGIPEFDPFYDPEQNNMDMTVDDPNAPHRAHPNISIASGNHAYSDWFHQNSLDYDEGDPSDPSDDAIYVTGRHQSMLVKINAEKAAGSSPAAGAVEWIYTDPSWLPQSSLDLKSLLLKPEGQAAANQTDAELRGTEVPVSETDAALSGIEAPAGGTETAEAAEQKKDGAGATNQSGEVNESEETHGEELMKGSRSPEESAPIEGATPLKETAPLEDTAQADGSRLLEKTTQMHETGQDNSASAKELKTSAETAGQLDAALTDHETQKGGGASAANETEQKENNGNSNRPGAANVAGLSETEIFPVAVQSGGSAYPYIYGPHAVERIENGDLLVYDNHLYGSKTEQKTADGLFSRAVRLKIDEKNKTFRIDWEYGVELGSRRYTPFIGDVDYIGQTLSEGAAVTDDHYLIDFGGITKMRMGDQEVACDVMQAMLSPTGSISAELQEYDNGKIIWSAYFQGAKGKVSSVYRAERVNLNKVPFSALDYTKYSSIANRGMYLNTPQVSLDTAILNKAIKSLIPVKWKLLNDEGNRLIGSFTLPHAMMDDSDKAARAEKVCVLLDMGRDGQRIYEAKKVSATPALGILEPYYSFEIMKDNKAAQIKLLIQRADGIQLLGSTGEIASATMNYANGELPVVDPQELTVELSPKNGSLLEAAVAAQGKTKGATLIFIQKGALEPGKKYVYVDPATNYKTDLVYSPLHGGYVTLINGSVLSNEEAVSGIQTIEGSNVDLRVGIVADDRNASVNGALRTKLLPEDIFYIVNQAALGTLPYRDTARTLAMDADGDFNVTPMDALTLVTRYLGD